MKKLLFIVALLSFIYHSYGLRIPGFPSGSSMRRLREKLLYPEIDKIDCSFVKVANITSKVDNFDPNNTDTWNQVRDI